MSDFNLSLEEIDGLKYADLRKIAKKYGIKANLKGDKIVDALKALQKAETTEKNGNSEGTTSSESEIQETTTESSETEHDSNVSRRGKRLKKIKQTKTSKIISELVTSDEEQPFISKKASRVSCSTPKPTLPKVTPKSSAKARVNIVKNESVTPRSSSSPSLGKKPTHGRKSNLLNMMLSPQAANFDTTPAGLIKARIQKKINASKKEKKRNGKNSELAAADSHCDASSEDDEVIIQPKVGSVETKCLSRSVSPGTKDLMNSMHDDMSDEQQKDSLIAALKIKTVGRAKSQTATQIPRFIALTKSSNKEQKKTPGKNWQQIHQKEFRKMDSLGDYIVKKRKRAESLNQSVKKLKTMKDDSVKQAKTPGSINKPTQKRRGAIAKPNATPSQSAVAFKPKVMTTAKMNLNFGDISKCTFGETKTPKLTQRRSPRFNGVKSSVGPKPLFTIGRSTSKAKKPFIPASASKENRFQIMNQTYDVKPLPTVQRKSVATPFKKDGDDTIEKQTFDLQGSLAKPVSWAAHKGKLRPFAFGKPFLHQTDVKEVKVKSREDRRKEFQDERKKTRRNQASKRRGMS